MRTRRTTLTLRTTDTRETATTEMTSANAGIAEAMKRLEACKSKVNAEADMIDNHRKKRDPIRNEFEEKDNLFVDAGIPEPANADG